MTEQELFELLGNLDSRYIAEAQGFRSGRMQLQRVRKKKKRMQHICALAAMLVVSAAVGFLVRFYFAENWVQSKQTPETSTMLSVQDAAPATAATQETFSAETQDESAAAGDAGTASNELERYYVNSAGEQIHMTLLECSRFRMYVIDQPDENGLGWVYSTVTYGYTQADRLTYTKETLQDYIESVTISAQNEEGYRKLYEQAYPNSLTVLYRPEKDLESIQEWVRQMYPDRVLEDSSKGNLYSTDGADVKLKVFFTQASGGYLVEIRAFTDQLEAETAMGQTIALRETPADSTDSRPDTIEFTIYNSAEESEKREVFQLLQEDGWSTYLPMDGNWVDLSSYSQKIDGRESTVILNTQDYSLRFTVVKLENMTESQCVPWAMELYKDLSPIEMKDGSVSTEDKEGNFLTVRFAKYSGGYYATISQYPISEMENLSTYIEIMADNFMPDF